ncbi:tripartite tricarboxylate transporter substrate-binding protein [Paraburkholderia sp. MM5384-R2]|uniref:tripartite tricarboxylate transporter substrate-binding protein n=1 Tax=Paraburkholderia sp. MM5384-R2 TaxID=2723097 RepID=UPI0016106E4E|nr:tripartite tricarboxylate transporter substrate-binding protein [Paraburkholderia sp. MM5384-R2]MBB5503178.1 hypothetical protein [Paraburkholderia sp. MM5384-R2]
MLTVKLTIELKILPNTSYASPPRASHCRFSSILNIGIGRESQPARQAKRASRSQGDLDAPGDRKNTMDVGAWQGLLAPKRTTDVIVTKLGAALQKALGDPACADACPCRFTCCFDILCILNVCFGAPRPLTAFGRPEPDGRAR